MLSMSGSCDLFARMRLGKDMLHDIAVLMQYAPSSESGLNEKEMVNLGSELMPLGSGIKHLLSVDA